MKKTLSLLISLAMILSMFSGLNLTVHAEETSNDPTDTSFPYSDSDVYVADSIIKGIIDKEGVAHGSSEISMALLHNYTYHNLSEALIDDSALVFDSVFWQNLKSTLSGDFLNITNWQEEMYILLIIDYLNYYSQSTEFESNFEKNTVKFTEDIYKAVIKYANNEYLDNVDDLIKNQSLSDAIALSEKWGVLNKLNKYNSVLGDIETVSNTAVDYYKNLSKALSVQKADESRIEFLQQMKKAGSDNYYFVTAVNNVISMYKSSYSSLAFAEGSKTMLEHGMSVLFSEAKKACPEAAAIIDGLKIYTEGLNWLFNSDDISKNNLKLIIVYTIGSYASSAVRSLRDTYSSNPTDDNANAFINGYIGYLKYQEYASNSTIGFVSSALFDGIVNQIKNIFSDENKATYNEFKEYLNNDISFCEKLEELIEKHYDLYLAIVGYKSTVLTDNNSIDNLTEIDSSNIYSNEVTYNFLISGQSVITNSFQLTDDLTICGDLYLNGGTLDLNGYTLTVYGNLIQSGGKMFIDEGILNVGGDYRIQTILSNGDVADSSGYLRMTNNADLINIKGDFITQSSVTTSSVSNYNYFSAGTMKIGGNFYQYDAGSLNFSASGSHLVVLNGSDTQLVHFNSKSSHFNFLEITKDKNTGYIFDPDNCWNKLITKEDINSVKIYSQSTTVKQGDNLQFISKINGSNISTADVIWSISGNTDSNTAISDKGVLSVSLNEKAKQITVTATSVADNTKSATVTITIEEIVPIINGIAITPSVVSTVCGQSCLFNAVVFGFYNPSQTVIWSISGNQSSNTKIDSNGLLTIADNETSKQITVKAVSSADNTKIASVTVDVMQIKIISTVDNVTVTMETGETQQLKAVVTGTNNLSQKVVWSVSGNSSENTVINDNGEITIGKDETSSLIIVKAVSAEDSSKYGEFAISIKQNTLIGDTNGDGNITIADATVLQKYLANIVDFDDKQLAVADTNSDGSVSIVDATQIQKYLANIVTTLG